MLSYPHESQGLEGPNGISQSVSHTVSASLSLEKPKLLEMPKGPAEGVGYDHAWWRRTAR